MIFIHPNLLQKLTFCEPSDLNEELHSVAFRSNLGEFSFSSFSTEALTSSDSMVADFAQALSVSQGTRQVILVGDMTLYGDETVKALQEAKDREVCHFSIDPNEAARFPFRHCNLGYSLLHALGVRPEELE